jgi:hypothetical protein
MSSKGMATRASIRNLRVGVGLRAL